MTWTLRDSLEGQSPRNTEITFLVPVFNDWDCVTHLVSALEATPGLPERMEIVLVDDGSTENPIRPIISPVIPMKIIRMGANLGHQRAIAVGLVSIAQDQSTNVVIVIDADGEDRPEDCQVLWQMHIDNPSAIVVAQRLKRSETVQFRLFYHFYRWFFRVLTGKSLDFGNFSVLPWVAVERLVLMPELWSHFPVTVMKSRLPLLRVPLNRGSRFAGRSRMNFISLVNHGLAGIAAFADTVYARLLAWSVSAMILLGVTVLGGVIFRLSTENPLPGWLALSAVAAFVALFQITAALVVVSFLTLSQRAQPTMPPTKFALSYVADIFPLSSRPMGNISDP